MEFVLALAIVVVVAFFVTGPLRRPDDAAAADPEEAELADLEARKEAAYRSIRDAETDHAAGKLSDADFQRLDREARREAIGILKRIDRLRGESGAEGP
jgi:hypothetical protein